MVSQSVNTQKFANKQFKIKEIPVLSFFTGGGFLDLGFEQAGFKIVWNNECNPVFADMHEYGMTTWRHSSSPNSKQAKISDRRSIVDIATCDIIEAAFPLKIPELFGMIGGPPCPDFSIGGKNRGHNGIHGPLSNVYIDRICEIKPDFFLFENVAGLFRTKKHRKFLAKLENQLEENGYNLDLRILNALELGLPQDRERLFIIGIKHHLSETFLNRELEQKERGWFPWPECPQYKNAKKMFDWPTIVQKNKIPEKPAGIPDELMIYHILSGSNPPDKLPNGKEGFKPYSNKFNTIEEGDTNRKSFKRLHRYRYSPTACYGHNEVHIHPWEKRRLTVRETMRLQGIPDTYILPSEIALTQKYALIANGVPVPLARHVAKSLYDLLLKAFI